MCIDDYEFRHYSAVRQKQCRRFIITDQDQIEKVFLVNISQFQENQQIALCKILLYLAQKGLQITNRIFYIPKFDVFLQPKSHCKVPFNSLNDKQIIFRSVKKERSTNQQNYHSSQHQMKDEANQNRSEQSTETHNIQLEGNSCKYCIGNSINEQKFDIQKMFANSSIKYEDDIEHLSFENAAESHPKRIKQPERKIGQVILAVKKWRILYQTKKMKLTNSAKLIGISKKSLDDYYLVLRIGQILGFNYAENLDNKMGDLRAYIRSMDNKISGKLSKQVKCFSLVPDIQVQEIMEEEKKDQETQKQNLQ